MSISVIQVTANATTSTFIGHIPNGICNVVITNDVNASVLVGTGSNLNQSNGLAMSPNSSVSFHTYPSSKGSDMYALIATGGTTGQVSMLISSTD